MVLTGILMYVSVLIPSCRSLFALFLFSFYCFHVEDVMNIMSHYTSQKPGGMRVFLKAVWSEGCLDPTFP